MNITDDRLCKIFNDAGVGWYLQQSGAPPLAQLRDEFRQLSARLKNLLGKEVDIEHEFLTKTEHCVPLIQTFACPMSMEMRAMVFCLLDDAEIASLRYEYQALEYARLEVVVRYKGGNDYTFRSDNLWDTEVLQHLGFAKVNGRPFLDGYYATVT